MIYNDNDIVNLYFCKHRSKRTTVCERKLTSSQTQCERPQPFHSCFQYQCPDKCREVRSENSTDRRVEGRQSIVLKEELLGWGRS